MLSLYPAIEPFHHDYLTVTSDSLTGESLGAEHQLYIEQCGNPLGIPVVFLHGGPGSGCRPSHRCYFDPQLYHIILFDQRGCGRSRPNGSLADNTSADIIQDMESIRQHLSIKQWLVFGGSWGATLGLYYAQHFSERVAGLILRGTFLAREKDIDWFYQENGAAKIFPEAWYNLVKDLEVSEQSQPLSAIYKQVTSDDANVSKSMLNKIQHWEANLINWQDLVSPNDISIKKGDKVATIIQLYYSMNQCFMKNSPLLESIHKIRHIPTQIIHGRFDMVCLVEQAWLLKKSWPEAKLSIIEMAGHVASEEKIIDALVKATNEFANLK
jgi:proline iminopeptidase